MDRFVISALMHAGQHLVMLTMVCLAGFSVYSLSVIGERWWTLRRNRAASAGLLRRVLGHVDDGKLGEALAACGAGARSHLSAVLAAGLRELLPLELANPGLHGGPALERAMAVAREAMQRTTAAEIDRLEERLTSLATLGNISPFVGLFGTVIGIMRAFEAISRTGSGGLASVSAGIAEALVATAAGLFVAIPAVTAYNYFVGRVKSCVTEMDGAASEMLGRLARAALSRVGGTPERG
jgi:biopolymer transport protein ExbB/TolQ